MIEKLKVILKEVKEKGDEAVLRYTEEFDHVRLEIKDLRVKPEEIERARHTCKKGFLSSIKKASENIYKFQQRSVPRSWIDSTKDGVMGEIYKPISRVGIYVPGGRYPYPSTVLMTAIVAKIAGVKRIVICTPPNRDKQINPYTLVAADLIGVKEIYKVGGAQAIFSLTFGTESIPKVDKIVGPGNIYVSLAKKLVYGYVGIDMVAGPSEVLILADEVANPRFIIYSLLSQAEHDPESKALLVTPSDKIAEEVDKKLPSFPIILVKGIEEGIDLINTYSPEHLELHIVNPWDLIGSIKNAGAIFLGGFSPTVIGDYFAGPSHVLPTGGWAKFSSGLGVSDFMKRVSIISYTEQGLRKNAKDIIKLAETEGLGHHANAIKVRLGRITNDGKKGNGRKENCGD
ncbi:MAG: histidinol dehydrogenase [bacterium]|nr:histidinol dehydrogenase [bacterium]